MEETTVDLAVVGGGPTGMLTALLAKRMGASVCVLDGKPRALRLGRADALNARSQQYLTIVGILDDLSSQGLKCNTSSIFADGEFTSRQSHWWEKLEYVLHKNFLMIGQPVVEQILAAELGDSIMFSEPVESVRENENGVDVYAVSGYTVHATYCVAADGARSATRQALDIPFKGTKPEMTWAVLDTFMDSDFPRCPEIITFQLNGESRVAWIPREREMCRFYILLDGEISEERSKESIKKHLAPYRVEFTKKEWFSTFEVKERVAETFISRNGNGRIILAGDAAHCHSVNGGQGLNTGLSDAFGLGWRMAYILKHGDRLAPGAAQKILQSFDVERRKVAENVVAVAARLVRDTKHEASQYVGNVEKNAAYITGMGITYDGLESPVIRESETGLWKAGRPCPDFELKVPGSTEEGKWFYQTVEYGKFRVLVSGDHGGNFGKFNDLVAWHKLVPNVDGPADLNGEAAATFLTDIVKAGEEFAVVVRPDMYLAYAGTVAGATEYLSEIFAN